MGKYTMLKNDDRLKTGAWIMVRNKKRQKWRKRQFYISEKDIL